MGTLRVVTVQGGCRCPIHGLVRGAEYAEQDPAPCGCAWVWERGQLVARDSRQDWWQCQCGRELEQAPHGAGSVALCECGRLWRFDHWALSRWPGDTGVTPLEPRQV